MLFRSVWTVVITILLLATIAVATFLFVRYRSARIARKRPNLRRQPIVVSRHMDAEAAPEAVRLEPLVARASFRPHRYVAPTAPPEEVVTSLVLKNALGHFP